MRVIQFRGKSVESNQFVYGSLSMVNTSSQKIGQKNGQMFICNVQHAWQNTPNGKLCGYWTEVHPETIGQLTECPERDGDVIYEGDIVRHYVENEKGDCTPIDGEVKMINGCWCVLDERYPLFTFPNELIGNIHENKNLLP